MHISPVLVGGALNGDRAQERGYLMLYIATVFNVFVHDYTHAKGCGCVYMYVKWTFGKRVVFLRECKSSKGHLYWLMAEAHMLHQQG